MRWQLGADGSAQNAMTLARSCVNGRTLKRKHGFSGDRYTLSRALFFSVVALRRTLQHYYCSWTTPSARIYGSRSDSNIISSSHQTLTCLTGVRRLPLPLPRLDLSALASHLHNGSHYLSGTVTLHQTNTVYEPNVSANANVSFSAL